MHMFSPLSRVIRIWNGMIFLAVSAYAVEIPLRLVIGYVPPEWLNRLDLLGSLLFAVDIVIQFSTARLLDGRLVATRSAIARDYSRGWFVPDLIAALPLDQMIVAMGTSLGLPITHMLALGAVARMLRLLRIVHLVNILRGVQRHSTIHPGLLRMATLAYWILLGAHWASCGWMWILNAPHGDGLFIAYLNALYWVLTTIATVGYGDITPDRTNPLQLIYTMVVMILGVGVYGYLIGNIASIIANLDIARSHHQEKMQKLTAFMRYRKLPEPIQTRIRDYYNYLWESRRGYDEVSVVGDLPESLRADVSLHLNKEVLEKVPMFRGGSAEFIRELVMELRPYICVPGDFVFRKGEFGDRMYFISKGSVEVVAPDGEEVYAFLSEGSFFGEMALVFDQPRTASARAADFCDLYYLDKTGFDRVLGRFPEFKRHVVEYAEMRRRQPGGTIEEGA